MRKRTPDDWRNWAWLGVFLGCSLLAAPRVGIMIGFCFLACLAWARPSSEKGKE
jgi:hypothetical protein